MGAGTMVACPKCSQPITVPSARPAAPLVGKKAWLRWVGVATVVLAALGGVWLLISAKSNTGRINDGAEPTKAVKSLQSQAPQPKLASAPAEFGPRLRSGSLDTSFNAGMGGNGHGWVECLTAQPDGKLLVAGQFSEVNGTVLRNIARLNPDGSVDLGFQPVIELDEVSPFSSVSYVAVQPDGKIVLGGFLKSVNGSPVSRLARLNPDGRLDDGFQPGLAANDWVFSVAFQRDGRLVVAGSFTNSSRQTASGLVRLMLTARLTRLLTWIRESRTANFAFSGMERF
jgi:uncharacterized delta-60 repeat protein